MLSILAVLALTTAPLPVPFAGPRWTLAGLTPDGGRLRVPGTRMARPAFTVHGGRLTGTTGCSPLRARVAISGNSVRIWNVQAGTGDFCPDHALALREDFTTLLERVTRVEWRGSTLILHAGTGRLEFTSGARP
ncbi:heat shock protein HslJ [Deinococcus metalli]|nr:META domain-containing protein [Deinococcus metalli]MBB5377901.1 heat shock protein HslJ [Deinococcus metalli]